MVRKTMHAGTKTLSIIFKIVQGIIGEVHNVTRNEMGHHQT